MLMLFALAINASAGVAESVVTTEETKAPISLETTYASDKVWRGSDLGQNQAEAVLSTSFDLPAEIALGLSAAYETANSDLPTEEETQLTAVFSKSIEQYLLGLSYTWYSEDFDKTGSGQAQEVGLSVARQLGPVGVCLTQYLATEGDNNAYSELALLYSNDFDVLPIEVKFRGELGYKAQDNSFTHAEVRVFTELPVVGDVVASPFVAYNVQLGDNFITERDSNNLLFGGLEFKKSF